MEEKIKYSDDAWDKLAEMVIGTHEQYELCYSPIEEHTVVVANVIDHMFVSYKDSYELLRAWVDDVGYDIDEGIIYLTPKGYEMLGLARDYSEFLVRTIEFAIGEYPTVVDEHLSFLKDAIYKGDK